MIKRVCVFMVIIALIIVGCKGTSKKVDYASLSISDQIAELENRKEQFLNFKGTYDDYADIHDFLYPDSKNLDDEEVFQGTTKVLGNELSGKNLKEGKEYLNTKTGGLSTSIESLIEKNEISISDVYKDNELDWYYIFVMKNSVVSGVEINIPSRYTLEKINGNYQVVEYNTDYTVFPTGDNTTTKEQKYISFNSEPVTYIKTIIIK